MIDAVTGILVIPAAAAALLAVLPGYRMTARINVLAALATFVTACSLFVVQPTVGRYLLVDHLNKVFIVLTTFIAFTTSVFSASYIGHEMEVGRLTPTEAPQFAGDPSDPIRQIDDAGEIARRLLDLTGREHLLPVLRKNPRRGDRLPDLMPDAGRYLAERRQPVGLRQLFAQRAGSLVEQRLRARIAAPAHHHARRGKDGKHQKAERQRQPPGRHRRIDALRRIGEQVQHPSVGKDRLPRVEQRDPHRLALIGRNDRERA